MGNWQHQTIAIEKARNEPNLALFHEIGVGKTKTMIEILREDYTGQKALRNTLVFAPLSVCQQWKTEFLKWSKISPEDILVLTKKGTVRAATLAKRVKPCIVVTNYEGVRIKDFYAALLKWSPNIVILDESHRIKDSESQQAKRVYPLAHAADRRFILTGTPFLNSILDIFGQYKALDPNIFGTNKWVFQRQYFYDRNAGRPNCNFPDWQPRPTTAAEIAHKIAASSVQAKKSECLDLPPLVKVQIPVELSPEQSKLYLEMKRHYVTELKGQQIIAEFAMTKTLRMQQILAGFVAPDAETDPKWVDNNPRLDALSHILETINGEKTIIWTTFRPTYRRLGDVAEKAGYKVAYLTGDQSTAAKQLAIESFTRGDTNALIANPSAGGTGINLQESKYSIYYTRGYSLEHFLQSEGRNYRGGSERHDKVTHYHLVSAGTLDEVIATALLNKQDIGQTILAWTKAIEHDKAK